MNIDLKWIEVCDCIEGSGGINVFFWRDVLFYDYVVDWSVNGYGWNDFLCIL